MIEILFTLIGTYIGAGFISGKEIYLYFYKYGNLGLLGIILSNLFISVTLYKTIIISKNKKIDNYKLFNKKILKNKLLNKIIYKIINLYFLAIFCLMISGFCNFINQEIKINKNIIYLFLLCIIYMNLNNNFNRILKINKFIIPMIIGTLIILNKLILKNNNLFNNYNKINFLVPSIIYANYNLISLIPIGVINQKKIKNTKKLCIYFFIIMIFLSFIIFKSLGTVDENILQIDFPIIKILEQHGNMYKLLYCVVLGLAIYTTALSTGYNYVQNSNRKMLVLIVASLLLIQFSFSKLIEIVYPIFGICGFVQCVYILKEKTY